MNNGQIGETTLSRSAGPRLRALLVPTVRPADVARKAGISRGYLSDVLAGRRPPTLRIIRACDELGVPVEVVFGRDVVELVRGTPREDSS